MYHHLGEVKNKVACCTNCELHKTRTNTVFGEGSIRSDLMFIGEGPGYQEDLSARPFVGPAGQLLTKMIESIGLKREKVYIANVVKCRPPGNADPKPEYAEACIQYLREQVRFIHPKVIVCLGRIAMRYVLNETRGITTVHGTIYDKKGFFIVPTFHPAALLRNEALKYDAWEDFKTIKRILEEEG